MDRILRNRIPEKITRNTELDPLISELKQEVVGDYDFSVRKSIGELLLISDVCQIGFFSGRCMHAHTISFSHRFKH